MEERFIATQFGSFSMVQWSGSNTSGIRALCDKIVVLPDQAPDMIGGIVIPEEARDRQGTAATTGVLVSVGPQAFAYDSQRLVHWVGDRPKAGDRVWFMKYAGQEYTGRDGLLYRVMEDRSIAGVEEPLEIGETAEAAE